ncbi:S41 family peptidase [Tenacibaculum amylolyticum]|uniref:S41 family peptidase n=1 Tax=Tenacibaculum amylolyticum TaxID=104269 RepID=UPI0038954621
MKAKKLALLALLLISSMAYAQKLTLEKASPFTAVKWENETPIVQFNNEWYQFEKLDNFKKEELIKFCKKEYGKKWKKRFSEDLVEVLQGMNYKPEVKVRLQLSKEGKSKEYIGTFSRENRDKVWAYNSKDNKKLNSYLKALKKKEEKEKVTEISSKKAIEDINVFIEILESKSSYVQVSDYDYKKALSELKQRVKNKKQVNTNYLVNELGKIMAEIGDRHSSVKNENFDRKKHSTYSLELPFGLQAVEGKIAVMNEENTAFYNKDYHYLNAINGIPVAKLTNELNYRNKKAPKEARLSRGADKIQRIGRLFFENNMELPKTISVTLENDQHKTKTVDVVVTKKNKYRTFKGKVQREHFKSYFMKDFKGLDKLLKDNIGYIAIPMMGSYKKVEEFEKYLEETMEKYKDTKALIIDVRGNPGGVRDVLQTLAPYFIQPNESPWIANVAFLRANAKSKKSMNGRYLYSYNSEKLTNKDRKAIDAFNKSFKIERDFDESKFTEPYYMVLKSGDKTYTKPVYILVDEYVFSAASVFTSALKGLSNVKIAGVTTDGSSGNSKKLYLPNSGIRVKVSTMLSFQRNGKTLDGNGTEPDIYIPIEASEIALQKDVQLEKLLKHIK